MERGHPEGGGGGGGGGVDGIPTAFKGSNALLMLLILWCSFNVSK